jgi:hypothetical protein
MNFDGYEFEFNLAEGFYGASGANQVIPVSGIERPADRNGFPTNIECLTRSYVVLGRYLPEIDDPGADLTYLATPWARLEYVVPLGKDYIQCYFWYGNGMTTYDDGTYDPSSGPNGNWYETDRRTTAGTSTNHGSRNRQIWYELSEDVSLTVSGPYAHAVYESAQCRSVSRISPDDPREILTNKFTVRCRQ